MTALAAPVGIFISRSESQSQTTVLCKDHYFLLSRAVFCLYYCITEE